MIRLDIVFVVQVLSQYMHASKQSHMDAAMRVVRYIKGTTCLGLFMPAGESKEVTQIGSMCRNKEVSDWLHGEVWEGFGILEIKEIKYSLQKLC